VDESAEALVVSFLSAFRTPQHEAEAKKLLAEAFPQLPVICSHEVWPQIREYERTIVAVLAAYVRPRVVRYLETLERELAQAGVRVPVYITKSNGGVTTARDARQASAETLLSGPASGVIGATYVCRRAGYTNLITLDMGGTSADIALVPGGEPVTSTDEVVGDFPVVMPAIGVSSIGAGGGSVAWLDPVGVLKIGPRSAGADPGPACYGRGGREPTLSDAFLLCGFLNPANFVGGRLRLYPEAAAAALQPLADALGLGLDAAAEAVVEVATANMYAAFSNVLARHGVDPREFALVAFGGAGPLHANALGRLLGSWPVIIPPSPGVLCAYGDATTRVRNESARTFIRRFSETSNEEVERLLAELATEAAATLDGDGVGHDQQSVLYQVDVRYHGQGFEVPVDVDLERFRDGGLEHVGEVFDAEHTRLFTFALDTEHELVNLRAVVQGRATRVRAEEVPAGGPDPAAAATGTTTIWVEDGERQATVYDRALLQAGNRVQGPAVVTEMDSTTLILPGHAGEVDRYGNLLLRPAPAEGS
ncbi:MAG TPA: hydantoinase/oxoprolinase family protein, partial [Actinomycetota bacterium]|nr:hydantoinase/oxoprolinase family protein [Actinomycetota bacterium]